MPDTATVPTLHHPDPATIARAAHDFAHSHYRRIDWTGAQVDFTAGAQWILDYLYKKGPHDACESSSGH